MVDDRIVFEKDARRHVARITINRPDRKNAMTTAMYRQITECLDNSADDDEIKVVILRGAGGCFTSGRDMTEVWSWYNDPNAQPLPEGEQAKRHRPSQRRRLVVNRRNVETYYRLLFHPKATIAQVEGFALGAGFEFLLSADLSVVSRTAKIGVPATRYLGPILGDGHLFFSRLGAVLAKDLFLTGRVFEAGELAERGIFTRCVEPETVAETTEQLAELVARLPADGIVMAKEAYRLIEESMGFGIANVCSYLFHAYATNMQLEPGDFNYLRSRSEGGVKASFADATRHFEETPPERR